MVVAISGAIVVLFYLSRHHCTARDRLIPRIQIRAFGRRLRSRDTFGHAVDVAALLKIFAVGSNA
jgi:hypothetical protein